MVIGGGRGVAVTGCGLLPLLIGDRLVDRRLAHDLAEAGGEEPSAEAREEPADDELSKDRRASVAGEGHQVTAVMEELVDRGAVGDRDQREQRDERAGEEGPRPQLAELDGGRVNCRLRGCESAHSVMSLPPHPPSTSHRGRWRRHPIHHGVEFAGTFARPIITRSGRVAQWESARFTRERSLVRNQPRPSVKAPLSAGFSSFSGGSISAPKSVDWAPVPIETGFGPLTRASRRSLSPSPRNITCA